MQGQARHDKTKINNNLAKILGSLSEWAPSQAVEEF